MFINADPSNIVVKDEWERADAGLIEAVAKYPVALIGDCVGRIGMMTSCIRPQTQKVSFHGTILPVIAREGDNLAIHRGLDEARSGDVLVVDAHAETNRAVFGDILGEVCNARGIAGVIIDGATRDIDDLDAIGVGVHARDVNPAGPSKFGPGRVGFDAAVGNVVCRAGDAIFADRDGIIVIPADELETVLSKLAPQEAFENKLRASIRASVAQG